jgi:hypothetical protein
MDHTAMRIFSRLAMGRIAILLSRIAATLKMSTEIMATNVQLTEPSPVVPRIDIYSRKRLAAASLRYSTPVSANRVIGFSVASAGASGTPAAAPSQLVCSA